MLFFFFFKVWSKHQCTGREGHVSPQAVYWLNLLVHLGKELKTQTEAHTHILTDLQHTQTPTFTRTDISGGGISVFADCERVIRKWVKQSDFFLGGGCWLFRKWTEIPQTQILFCHRQQNTEEEETIGRETMSGAGRFRHMKEQTRRRRSGYLTIWISECFVIVTTHSIHSTSWSYFNDKGRNVCKEPTDSREFDGQQNARNC